MTSALDRLEQKLQIREDKQLKRLILDEIASYGIDGCDLEDVLDELGQRLLSESQARDGDDPDCDDDEEEALDAIQKRLDDATEVLRLEGKLDEEGCSGARVSAGVFADQILAAFAIATGVIARNPVRERIVQILKGTR